jgi:23S rRNA (pseudouridine1915-N3)-methyltransferase
MKWRVVVVGKPSLAYAKTGIEDYLNRLRHYAEVEMVWIKEGAGEAETTRRLLEQCEGCRAFLLDETGRSLSTREWHEQTQVLRNAGTKRVAVLIGGADGHPPGVRAAIPDRWSLGRHTLQHELALLVWLEQLYRIHTLDRGEPYHRD